MSSSDYEDILASVQDVVQRAYTLGRTEALKRVIEVMKSDDPPAKPLALSGPAHTEAAPAPPPPSPAIVPEAAPAPVAEAKPASDTPERSDPAEGQQAWWARPARNVSLPARRAGRG